MIFGMTVYDMLWYFMIYSVVGWMVEVAFHAWVYARRSERKNWWVLIPLYVIQIVCGILIMINPWWKRSAIW